MIKNLLSNLILIISVLFAHDCFAVNNNPQSQPQLPLKQIKIIESQLHNIISTAKQKFNLPGISLAILLPNQETPLLIITGNTLIPDGNPISEDTLFQVGSATKTFTATLLVKALDEKKLSLNDKLGKYLPEYPQWQNVTIGQLANQTSGIFDYINSKDWWLRLAKNMNLVWDATTLLNIAYQYPNNFPAGSKWEYSSTNYVLLGLVLEKVTHKSLPKLMSELVKSVSLHNTYYLPTQYSPKIMQHIAHGYGYYDKVYDMTSQNPSWGNAGAAMISTPSDLVDWMKIIFTTGKLAKYIQLKNTITAKNTISYYQSGYDFGLFRMNTPEGLIWFTPSLTPGYIAIMVYAPCQNIYFSYATNRAPAIGLHAYLAMNILHVINKNSAYKLFLTKNSLIPAYCTKIKPAKTVNFSN